MRTIFFVSLILQLCFSMNVCRAHDPTDGFTLVPLTANDIRNDKPYNVPLNKRYSYKNGVRRFWIYNHDKPFKPSSSTRPRSEVRIKGHDYTSGVWQFEGNFYVPSGTNGVCIMQVFGAESHATTLQLRVYDGNLRVYRNQVVASNIYDKWFKLNVIHDVRNSRVTIFINNEQKAVVGGRGPSKFYFKFGVYAQDSSSNYMESRWHAIRVFTK